MKNFRDRAKRYHKAIHDILIKDWDPIGVANETAAQDEYDSYIPGVYKLLIRRAPVRDLFEYLWQVETDHMGLHGNRGHTEEIARKLHRINEVIDER